MPPVCSHGVELGCFCSRCAEVLAAIRELPACGTVNDLPLNVGDYQFLKSIGVSDE